MRRRGALALALCVALSLLGVPGASHADAPIAVGVAATDLTWHVGQNRLGDVTSRVPDIAGQDVPDDPFVFAGLHSRPQAKAIVVAAPHPFAFVRADIVMVTGDLYEAVAQRVERETGIPPERLLLAATHTHVANNGLFPHVAHGVLFRSFDPRELAFLADQIAAAVVAATLTLRPATFAVGSGSIALPAENRRYTDRELHNQPPFATDPSRLDTELGVLRFDDAETGAPIAVLMNYGLHPVVLINNPYVSADFVGVAERDLERELADPTSGAAPMAIWFTGAQGDQDPIYVRYSYPENEWTGRLFGHEAARVARTLTPSPLVHAAIVDKLIPLPPPGGPAFPSAELAGPRTPVPGPASLLIPSSVRLHAIELSTASERTVLMSWPGEPIRDLGVGLKQGAHARGFDHAFVLALANDWAGYWLTPSEYDRGLYERTLMFYGRTSALYVSDQVLDLVGALVSGEEPTNVPLPPKAQLDRIITERLAAAAYTVDPLLRAAVLASPEVGAPAAVTQPSAVERPGVAAFVWSGGSPDVARDWIPRVRVERQSGSTWIEVAREGTGELLLANRALFPIGYEWSATWEALPDTLAGTYRFIVAGQRSVPGGQQPYALTSSTFAVDTCACIVATPIAVSQPNGSTLVRVAASYGPVVALPVPHTQDGFRLQPGSVTTGSATVEVLQGSTVVATLPLSFVSDIEPVTRTVTVRDISGNDLPVTITEPTELGTFQAIWTGATGVTFRVVSVVDGVGNSI